MTQDATLVKYSNVSFFTFSQANAVSQPEYFGVISSAILEALTEPLGDVNPIYQPSIKRIGNFDIVGFTRSAPDLGTATIAERLHIAAINKLEQLKRTGCPFAIIVKLDCNDPTTLDSFQKLYLVDTSVLTSLDYGTLGAFDEDQVVQMSGELSYLAKFEVVPIRFSEQAGATILANALDVIYADSISCGDCGPFSDGCQRIFTLTAANAGSPGLSSQIVYTLNGGTSYTSLDINTLGGQSANAIAEVGKYLVAVSETDDAHHYIDGDTLTAGSWVRVSTGYNASGGPRAIWSKGPTETFIAGAGGYAYRTDNITSSVTVIPGADGTATSQDLNAIHASGQTVLAVGDSNVILVSQNNGSSMSLVTGPEPGVDLTACWIVSANTWQIGTASGKLWVTANAGTTFTQISLPDQASLTAVNDIYYSPDTPLVGAIAVAKSGSDAVYRTVTGGRTWYDRVAIAGLPTNVSINAVALCGVNEIAAAGLAAASDGLLAIAR